MSFRILGSYNEKLDKLGLIGTIASAFLALSTASISDGGDMLWTWHSIGATGFFIIALYNCFAIGATYRKLWRVNRRFCPYFSYYYKVSMHLSRLTSI